MSNQFCEHLTDQQKIEAVDNLFSMYGKEMPERIKHFLFIIQNAFLTENMLYCEKAAADNIYHLYDFFTRLEAKTKDDE